MQRKHSMPAAPLRARSLKFMFFGMFSALASMSFIPPANAVNSGADFDWQKISPSPVLKWVACYERRECARLEVPLDYSEPTGDKAAVALLRIKANVSSDSKEYRGPILFNPGGPGGSGVVFINQSGDSFQQMLGNEYDIVGFDPRGIGETTPAVSIFPTEVERAYWNAGNPPLINSTTDALHQAFFRTQLSNDLVVSRSKRAAEHVSTAVVARDMLSIIKAHGRDKLQYWGFSYGTVLGATFAALFPDKVERLIIDGVVDFDDYFSAAWSKALLDTDKILQFFYDKCASAGDACPLHANSSALVQERVENILASLKTNPIPAINGSSYALIDFTTTKQALYGAAYTPFSSFPVAAEVLAELEKGDGRGDVPPGPVVECNATAPPIEISRLEAQLAVMCGEMDGVGNTTADIAQHFEELSKTSIFADVWTDTTWTHCAGWKIRAKERYAGPFTANTSFPLLVIGNTADPVTPLAGAQKAAKTFGSAVLLTVNTPGHSSLAATSLCSTKAVRNYFRQGELPANGTVCEIQDVLFGDAGAGAQNMTTGDAELLEMTKSMSHSFHASRRSRFL